MTSKSATEVVKYSAFQYAVFTSSYKSDSNVFIMLLDEDVMIPFRLL